MIRFYKRQQIDDDLWNSCVKRATESSIKGHTWYLDTVCENWSALILNDYEAVLPLPVKSKFTISYLFQPLFLKLLNIYSDRDISVELVHQFLDAIPSSIKLIDVNLNVSDVLERADFVIETKVFQLLDISLAYETIAENYKGNVRRNLKKAQKNNLTLVENVSVEQVVELLKNNIGYKVKHLKASGYNVLRKVMKQTLHYRCGFTVGVIDENKQLLAATFCLLSKNKIHCILESSTPVGKDFGAMFFMRDEIIKRYGKEKEAFDFEGSSIKGIADFNKSFGAKDCVYLHLKRNTLPYLLKKWSGKYL